MALKQISPSLPQQIIADAVKDYLWCLDLSHHFQAPVLNQAGDVVFLPKKQNSQKNTLLTQCVIQSIKKAIQWSIQQKTICLVKGNTSLCFPTPSLRHAENLFQFLSNESHRKALANKTKDLFIKHAEVSGFSVQKKGPCTNTFKQSPYYHPHRYQFRISSDL